MMAFRPRLIVGQVLGRDDPHRQHLRMRQRTLDVEHRQLVVEIDRSGIALDQFRHRFGETSRPGFARVVRGLPRVALRSCLVHNDSVKRLFWHDYWPDLADGKYKSKPSPQRSPNFRNLGVMSAHLLVMSSRWRCCCRGAESARLARLLNSGWTFPRRLQPMSFCSVLLLGLADRWLPSSHYPLAVAVIVAGSLAVASLML